MADDASVSPIPLREAIQALRNEILSARQDDNKGLLFQVGPIEVEFNVVAKRDDSGKAGFKFGILGVGAELGANATVSGERTQKVKFTLTPTIVDPVTGLQTPADISRNLAKPFDNQETGRR